MFLIVSKIEIIGSDISIKSLKRKTKHQRRLVLRFKLFIEISLPISLPILRGVCKVGISAIT